MIEKQTRFQKNINNIDFKMIRTDKKFWIKIAPAVRISKPSNLHISLNNEIYNWDIFNKDGIESHEIFFEGYDCNPSFYLNSRNDKYRIDFKNIGIKIILIKNTHKQENYIKKYCSCFSTTSSCWAKAIYYTSRPDKTPFNEM